MKFKVLVVILTGIIVALGAVSYLAISSRNDQNLETDGNGDVSQPVENGPISVRVATEKTSYTYGDTVKFSSTIENIGESIESFSFSTTCTDGTLYIDGKITGAGQMCGQAFTDVELAPGQEAGYEYVFELVRELSASLSDEHIEFDGELALKPGVYEAYLEWQGYESGPVSFEVTE